ncbi:hypothetical protein CEQ90_00320 [Lewinellaceae bacterium SD302]|nr:hypothetical protein CEQ90_00320 [Lewinellaceae bacterium SD302]
MLRSLTFYPLILLALITSCGPRQLVKPYNAEKAKAKYVRAVADAAKPEPWEISNDLIAIREDNSSLIWKNFGGEAHLLVSSWKGDTTYYFNDSITGRYNTGKYPIWVTASPELQEQCTRPGFGRREGLDLRLKQLFGMPPGVNKKYFVSFWVRPADLYRPCPDGEIGDRSCGLAFPDFVSDNHKNWVNEQRIASYYNMKWDANYPWTELGYTYDWNPGNKLHIGLSEFIIATNSNVIVKRAYTTEEFCAIRK